MVDQLRSRLALLKGGKRTQRVVDWPGKPGTRVAIRNLVGSESMAARLAAAEVSAQVPPGPGATLLAREAYEEEYAYQVLYHALVDPETGDRLAASAQEVRDLVDLDEVEALMEIYAGGDDDAPDLDKMSVEQLEREADDLGEASASGTSSSSSTERTGKRSSAFRVLSSPTGSSSTSTPSPGSPSPGGTAPAEADHHDNPAAEGPGRAGSSPGSTAPGS